MLFEEPEHHHTGPLEGELGCAEGGGGFDNGTGDRAKIDERHDLALPAWDVATKHTGRHQHDAPEGTLADPATGSSGVVEGLVSVAPTISGATCGNAPLMSCGNAALRECVMAILPNEKNQPHIQRLAVYQNQQGRRT